ncbi:glycogen debranching enzyme, partial [Plakobranchus ocellatus]
MPSSPQVRVFTLRHGENSENKLYRLEKGWTLRFVLGPSLMASNVRVFCNHPPNNQIAYKRSDYYEIKWQASTGISSNDRTDLAAEVRITRAGSFNFFFTVDGSDNPKNCNGSGYFLVDPTLHVGPQNEEITMDAISCQSVITKLLGCFDEWMPRLQVAAESGYNMVHFTPVQELGISNSAYSIRNQLHLSPVYTRPGSNKKYNLDDLENLVKRLNNDLGLMSLSDLVYNHTAKDSPWVLEHPECTFNMDNSAHLRPAYIVDRIFENFSLEVSKGQWEAHGIPKKINSEEHLNHPVCILQTEEGLGWFGANLSMQYIYRRTSLYNCLPSVPSLTAAALTLMSLSDLVYNHTAKDSPWVLEHPECTFNMDNSAHLRPAYIVDRIFENFSLEVSKGQWEAQGIPKKINSEEHLNAIDNVLRHKVFTTYRLHEFYCVSIEKLMKEFKKAIERNNHIAHNSTVTHISIVQDPQFRRFQSSVDMNQALYLYNTDRPGAFSREDRINKCCEALMKEVAALNAVKENELQDHLNTAITNFVANVRWRFVNPAGPQLGVVTSDEPLMFGYFVIPRSHEGGVLKEEQMSYEDGAHVMAVNGWVMSDDPLSNFAAPGRNVYLRRELIAWGDSVKLNYGNSPADCPYLWNHMEQYTRMSAKIFQGLRLDNCHSTPIHVAEHMLDIAREVRPDLYVIAELFTGSDHLDNLFMNRLGINSLIRESLNAWDAHEQGRLVYRFGGDPVGAFVQPRVRPLVPSVAHALFYDQTHDNECPIQKRSGYDSWPSGALVAIANCAIGSNRGFDQMVPIHINVVTEKRLYTSWLNQSNPERPFINESFGITKGKRALNRLHYMLARDEYNQVYVDQVDVNTVSVTRHKPQSHESVVLIARTAFQHPKNPNDQGYIRPIVVQ